MNAARELNLDALVGPTHHYGGLSLGNLASQAHRHQVSSPKRAALQGLEKMKRLADLGLMQAVLPPHERPDISTLRRLGFTGADERVIETAHRRSPELLSACASASAMWAANAATVSPGADTADHRVHFTPANLLSRFHRCLEPPMTAALLRAVFPDESAFAHHAPLPAHARFGDEGAANHMRLAPSHGQPGVEIFIYGRGDGDADAGRLPHRFPARQALDASAAVARLHGLDEARTLLLRQHPAAIDAGVFHNDVIAVANENVLLHHEHAFVDGPAAVDRIRQTYRRACGEDPIILEVREEQVPLERAVQTYLFNSQLLSLPKGGMMMLCPAECREADQTRRWLEHIVADAANPIRWVDYIDVRQSMQNGGGPACLRLRIVLDEAGLAAVHRPVMLDERLHDRLSGWVGRHYRDELSPADLADPLLLRETREALDELSRILALGSIYGFQRG